MQELKITGIASLTLLSAAIFAYSGVALSSEGPAGEPPAPAALCKEAIVNPVSGYAECVRPLGAPVDPPPPRPSVVKLAVFDFELDDVSPAAALLGQTTSNEAVMEKVSSEARRILAQSGRFILVDVSHVDAEPVKAKSLRNCDGCEGGIALQAGAEQALIGVVRRVTQTDYYVQVLISDAQTGKILNQQEANFAGGPDGWASGVRMLLKHQVLDPADEP
ncbi:MAG: DUF2380 domain-containing protein [Steroidobacteraceae bacterium]|jgi:hypothetical protein